MVKRKRNQRRSERGAASIAAWQVAVALLVMLIIYAAIFGSFLPNENGRTGHDYGFVMTRLMAGHYWFMQNGLFSIPWFSPFQCAGTVFFTDPQSFYFSVPQFLTFVVEPLTAVRWSMWLFAGLGGFGMWLLLRKVFALGVASAGLGAVLFMFNGFFAWRMVIGHVTFHGYMLVPLMAALVLWPSIGSRDWRREVTLVLGAGACYAYLFLAGAVHLMIPAGLILAGLILIAAMRFGWRMDAWIRLAAVGVVVACLGAAKLSAALGTIENLSRDAYLLPGFKSVWAAIWYPFQLLFFGPTDALEGGENLGRLFGGLQWTTHRHNWEYGISVVPLLLLLAGLAWWLRGALVDRRRPGLASVLCGLALVVIVLIPLAVNFYTPGWNALLKSLPVTKASVMLFRWYSMLIPLAIVGAALALHALPLRPTQKSVIALLGALIAIGTHGVTNTDYYRDQPYNPEPLNAAHAQAKASGAIVPIQRVVVKRDQNGKLMRTLERDDVMVEGASQLACYQALFGYLNEFMPIEPARAGSILREVGDGRLNFKNPACYTFPEANQCSPGDHFTLEQRDALTAFANYQAYPFNMPPRQHVALWVSGLAWLLVFGWLICSGLLALRSKLSG